MYVPFFRALIKYIYIASYHGFPTLCFKIYSPCTGSGLVSWHVTSFLPFEFQKSEL